ncbi:hypothetical protein D3C80_1462560 [compost metagenome]
MPNRKAITAAVMLPSTLAGMTASGSRAANGMAPSEIPTRPMAPAALPASISEASKMPSLRPSTVASDMPRGAAGMAQAMAPMNWVWPEAIMPTENRKATLLTGPPMSKPAMPPSTMPSSTRLPPLMESSMAFRPVIMSAMGAPMMKMKTAAIKSEPTMGAIRIGTSGCTILW